MPSEHCCSFRPWRISSREKQPTETKLGFLRPRAFPLGRSLSHRVSAAPNGSTNISSESDKRNSEMKTGLGGVVRVAASVGPQIEN